ncbi:MAG: histidine--tRNA ligase [Armatimonadota bacterium]|nr:histidine--tRNA ligase [Armatimonadota bacterium]
MEPKYRAPEGMNDVLPENSHLWQHLEACWREHCHRYGYREIRTPILEYAELFERSVGETSDIVSKEMYVLQRGEERYALKPEGTAPVVRAYIEHSLHSAGSAQKLYYITPFFRGERPQKGRYRQAHQMGAEIIGTAQPAADAELLAMVVHFFQSLGIAPEVLELRLNTIGCPTCRPTYREAVLRFGRERSAQLCRSCQARLERNPLRILDCKECTAITADAPPIDPYLCDECRTHFETLQQLLKMLDVPYKRDFRLVRGLDYYTRTTFEVIAEQGLGAQNALCGGGRYDGLVEELGGAPTPALGVGIGVERTLLVLQALAVPMPEPPKLEAYVVAFGDAARPVALQVAQQLRHAGISTDLDLEGRSPKAQMRLANRTGARFAVLLGETELAQNAATVKDLQTHEQTLVSQAELAVWIRNRLQTP